MHIFSLALEVVAKHLAPESWLDLLTVKKVQLHIHVVSVAHVLISFPMVQDL